MKIGVILFLSSMTFGIVIATIYGVTTHDVSGIIFLGLMAVALAIVSLWIVVAEREAHLAGDQTDMDPADAAGEEVGVYSTESYWPILAALGMACVVLGVVFIPGVSFGLLLIGAALVAWTVRFLVREST
ncbi:MAG: cytochrome c oxidase subunit 4 [Candidatus Eremiobacteraeota bacterium]|nr:cytochrome c oxidase subunit 4 [Candidatus Eremiobacteraeota bacterium]